jgi:hypothetical protein
MIRIKSKRAGFRRCGIAHSAEFVEYPDDRFSAKELAVLKAEPMLIVEIRKPAEGKSGDIDAMTVEQLKAEIAKYQPIESLKGIKKTELVEMLKAHREASGNKE